MSLKRPKLFETRKSFLLFMSFLFLLLLFRLWFEYRAYQDFISKPFYYLHANVLSAYTKHKKGYSYQVLKLRGEGGMVFYTTTHKLQDLSGRYLRLQLFPSQSISFWGFLGTFYVKSRIKEIADSPNILKQTLYEKVASEHKDPMLQAFYNAIFFAASVPKELREKISMLGVSHLVALSGFHLGILWGLVYGLLLFLYRPLQQRYFPYRFSLIDMGLLTVLILGLYVWFVDAPPSLVRSYAMLLIGWSMLLMGIELLSFTLLATVVALLLVLFPSLLVSWGFWFSVAGVFYIFLLLHYTKQWNKWVLTLLVIPAGIFLLMLPVVHAVFPVTSTYQLMSPLLSLLFVPFYPLAILLHLVGMGDMFDGGLQWLFSLPHSFAEHTLSAWILGMYVALSIAAVFYKKLFYILLGLSVVYGIYLFAEPLYRPMIM